MNSNATEKKSKPRAQRGEASHPPVMSEIELARLGGGEVAYIKVLSAEEARQLFPAVEGLPAGVRLFALHGADGSPLALTDSRQAALSHAMEGELAIASVH